jgi:hypothetical protein
MNHRSKNVPDSVPQAHGVGVFYCDELDCHRPHVMLFDEHENPIAHFVMPDDPSFMRQLQNLMYRSAVERNDE